MRRPPRSLPNKHDFADGDDVLGSFFAMGPGIKPDLRLMGFEASVYDDAPTILHIYGIEKPAQMRSHVLSEILKVQIPRRRLYSLDGVLKGREETREFLRPKWARDLDYRLNQTQWGFRQNG